MRLWKRSLLALVGLVVVLVGLILTGVGTGVALLAYVLVVAAVLLLWLTSRLRTVLPAAPVFSDRLPKRGSAEASVEQLDVLRRSLLLARSTRSDLLRLQPLVREIAGVQLARNHGIALDLDTERAAQLLSGTKISELLYPDPAWASDRRQPGWSPQELERLVQELENL